MKTLMQSLRVTAVTLVAAGLLYPLLVTALAQWLFPSAANGSVVRDASGAPVGSELIGQAFANPAYFQPRPSAAGDKGYDALTSGGSNLGPTSKKLRERVALDAERLRRENPNAQGPIPAELVTASGSGLDPHLSPEAVRWQLPRVARARRVAPDRVRGVAEDLTEGRWLGLFGEPRVNVLMLNRALDQQFGAPAAHGAPP